MVTKSKQVPIGKIIKPHGLKGEVFVRLSVVDRDFIAKLKKVYLAGDDEAWEWTVKKARPHKDGLLLISEEVSKIEEAETYRGYVVTVDKSLFQSKPGENFYLSEVEGFSVVDQDGRLRGEIVGFRQNGIQDLAVIKSGKGEFEMPFVDDLTLEKDWEGRSITLNIPEGLEDLNL